MFLPCLNKVYVRIPVTVTVVGDKKILPAPGANQIVGFSGYRPLTNREKINSVIKFLYAAALHSERRRPKVLNLWYIYY